MSKYAKIKVKVKKFNLSKLKVGDYFEYNDVIYKFIGYDYGTYPIGENIETKELITLPHY